MLTQKLKKLATVRSKLAALEQSIAADLKRELASLPERYGFTTTSEFLAAVTAAIGKRRGRKAQSVPGTLSSAGAKRRKRAKITDVMRAEVKKLAEEGKSGNEIAKAVGISLPSVQNIRKALGLVKKRSKTKKAE